MLDPNLQPLVFDNGSGVTKCGFAGDRAPATPFPSIIGRPKSPGIVVGMHARGCFVGEEAQVKRGILKLKYPVEHGLCTNWNDMEKLWHFSFYDSLQAVPEEHPVLLAEAPLNPANNREFPLSIFFETFQVPGLYLANTLVLALLASGRMTGLSVGIGDGVTHAVPVYEGHAIRHGVSRMNLAGRDITEYLVKLLGERGYELTTSAERAIVKDLKQTLCYVARSGIEEEELKFGSAEVAYVLPDGERLPIGSERYRAPEILFEPMMIGSEQEGLHVQICQSLQKSFLDEELTRILRHNIVLSGGSTMFEGLEERLLTSVRDALPKMSERKDVRIVAPTACPRSLSTWRGGSLLSCLSTFPKMCISKEEYDDAGSGVVHRRCF